MVDPIKNLHVFGFLVTRFALLIACLSIGYGLGRESRRGCDRHTEAQRTKELPTSECHLALPFHRRGPQAFSSCARAVSSLLFSFSPGSSRPESGHKIARSTSITASTDNTRCARTRFDMGGGEMRSAFKKPR